MKTVNPNEKQPAGTTYSVLNWGPCVMRIQITDEFAVESYLIENGEWLPGDTKELTIDEKLKEVYAKKYIDGNFANPRIAVGLQTTMIYALLKTQKNNDAMTLYEDIVASDNSVSISEIENFLRPLGRSKFLTEFFTKISAVATN